MVAPDAVLDDGLFDFIHVGALSRLEVLRLVPGLAVGRLPKNHPQIRLGRCRGVQLTSESPLIIHTDGEFFCLPQDGCRTLTVELLPQRLVVFSRVPQSISASQSS